MRSNLVEFLEGIELIPDQVGRCVDQAFNTFPIPSAVLSRWGDYVACMGRFHSHLERGILGLGPETDCDVEFRFGLCVNLMRRKYGESAIQAPFEMVRTGNEGGLLEVLRTLANIMSREHADNRIGAAVSLFLDRRQPQDIVDVGKEYVTTYGHLLPSELTEGSAVRVLASLPKVLREHPYTMRRYRQVGR